MLDAAVRNASILVVSDRSGDAALVKRLLSDEFDGVHTSGGGETAVADFEQHHPQVLVLAFDTLQKAERYLLGVYRHSTKIHLQPIRTITLCTINDVKEAYDMCRSGHFDDYVLFWPLTHDSGRLPMSLRIALRELAAQRDATPSAADFAARARNLAGMEAVLERTMAQGDQHIATTGRIVAQAQASMGAAIDGFSRRLAQGELSDMLEVRNAAGLGREIAQMKTQGLQQPLSQVQQSLAPLAQWAQELHLAMQPHLDSAHSLVAMAEQLRPLVLVVDDDEIQRDIVGGILQSSQYRVVFAASSREALKALANTPPDLILMDVMMPEVDGLQTTLQLRAVPRYARIPVIMVSGWSDGTVVRDSLKAGANDFIVKPVEPAALLSKIARALHPPGSAGLHRSR